MTSNKLFSVILTTVISLSSFTANSQANHTTKKDDSNSQIVIDNPDEYVEQDPATIIYNSVEVKPEFLGPGKTFQQYVLDNFKVPKDFDQDQQLKIYSQFVIEKDGSLSNIKIIRDPGFGIGIQVLAILKKSPKWKPGMQNGKIVRTLQTVVIDLKPKK